MEEQKIQRNLYLAHLVTEEVAGTITDARHRELEAWLEQSAANREMYRELCRELADAVANPIPEVDAGSAWKLIQEKLHRGKHTKRTLMLLIRRWSVAAAVAAVFGTGAFLYFHFGNPMTQQPSLADVAPGSARARLVLSGGEIVHLNKTDRGKALNAETGVTIRMDSGKVTYTVDLDLKKEAVESNTLIIPRGGEYVLQLGDGTRVWLNSATTLKYPAVFSGRQRLVELDGEAYFEVASHPEIPFIVKTSTTSVQVYGTSFNVCAYREDTCQYTTLLSGSVGVNWQGMEVRLHPGEQAVVDIPRNEIKVWEVEPEVYCSWHTGSFIFENRPLGEVLERLSRWYDVEVFYENPEVKQLHFTGDLNRYDDFGKILKLLEMTERVKFSVNGKTIRVTAI